MVNRYWNKMRCKQVLSGVLCCLAATAWGSPPAGHNAPYSTPPGITLIEVAREIAGSRPIPLWTQIASAQGETLYVSEGDGEGVSHCTGDCAKQFPPLLAAAADKAFGDWSLVVRGDERQWAYRGQPLYRFAKAAQAGEVIKNLIDERFKDDTTDLISAQGKHTEAEAAQAQKKLLPPAGWRVAEYNAAQGMALPTSVRVGNILAAGLVGFMDAGGLTLYAFAGTAEELAACADCLQGRAPVAAAELAQVVGDFAPIRRADGSRQWAWRGAALYTYGGDQVAGDINGIDSALGEADPRWYIPALARHFAPPGATVRRDLIRGPMLAVDGLPLYSRYVHQFVASPGSGPYQLYYRGKTLGTKACDRRCEESWRPYQAPAQAQSRGYWEIVEREDGMRQWAYRGFVLYTNVKDQANGQATQSHTFDYLGAGETRYDVTKIVVDYDKPFADAYWPALVWRVSSP